MTRPKRNIRFQHRRGSIAEADLVQDSYSDTASEGQPDFRMDVRLEKKSSRDGPLVLKPPLTAQEEYQKKKQTFITRMIWTFVMIAGFFGAMFAGHIYLILIVTALQIISFKEVIAIAQVPIKAKNLRFTKNLNWYFLAVSMYYLYGESIIYYFKHIILVDRLLLPFATHHRFISFILYLIGFVFFVLSLQKDHYKFQFSQFGFTHMALFLIVVQAHFIMNNIFEGIIWFFLPCSLVITNDIFAYICGITFGRTPLISISPKKTLEGFLGAWVCTIIFGYVLTAFMVHYKYVICPVNNLGANIFTSLECTPNPVFLRHTFVLPPALSSLPYLPKTITYLPMQLHVLLFSTFASLIAPFGGFFASGLKRTFKIKDFGESIPGHGGITDRMDCQFIMGFFVSMYYQSFIAVFRLSVGSVIEMAVVGLNAPEQREVVKALIKSLAGRGEISVDTLQCLKDTAVPG